MSIKKSTIDPSDQAIFDIISHDTMKRNDDACSFVELLDMSDDFSAIALNGAWGSGKTFFIKQAKILIDYLDGSSSMSIAQRSHLTEMRDHDSGNLQRLIESSHLSALYFDAWLYDDAQDPLRSLLYFMATSYSKDYATDTKPFSEKIGAIINMLNFWTNGDATQLFDAFTKSTAIQDIYDMEELKSRLKSALEDIIIDGNRLVVFVDELDRCTPTYAVKMLERIKHFFNSPNVLFVFSVNMEQLAATIKKSYGADFDSSGYLNKFFDFIVDVPPVSINKYLSHCGSNDSSYYLDIYYRSIINNMHMSMREISKYLDSLRVIYDYLRRRLTSNSFDKHFIISEFLFCPLILALKTADTSNYQRFIDGNSPELLWTFVNGCDPIKDYVIGCFFTGSNTRTPEQYKQAMLEFYTAVFKNTQLKPWVDISSDIYDERLHEIREHILNICTLYGIGHQYN